MDRPFPRPGEPDDREVERDLRARCDEGDVRIAQALFDVDVPRGLLDRLSRIPELAEAGVTVEETHRVEPARRNSNGRPSRVSRRAFWVGGVSAAVAASIGVGFWLANPATDFERWNSETLARRAIAWTLYLEDDARNREAWTTVAPERTERTLGPWIRRPPEAWGQYRLTGTHDRRFRGDVYRFGSAERADAMLFVVDAATVPGKLASAPTSTPGWTSEGFAVGMWRRGDKLFVFAVRGDAGDYARLIRRQQVA